MKQPGSYLSLETLLVVKILFFDADPGSGMEKIRIQEKHPGSATLLENMPFGGIRVANLLPDPDTGWMWIQLGHWIRNQEGNGVQKRLLFL